ncbi:TetR/AcrR family transcriptional regulator [Georgenia halophila]|uniref:TetR/AcrR family transcriptional regulator n=1 Tax=Georgenia halophila TaxID=620889 RepID=A0ABP8LGN9_9MICO
MTDYQTTTVRGTRGPYRSGIRRRAQIIEKAVEVFSSFGYRASTIREIADRVGITPAAVMKHFGGKEQLLLEVLRVWDEAQVESPRTHTGLDAIRGLRDRMIWHTEHPGLLELYLTLATEATDPSHPAHDYMTLRYAGTQRRFEQWLREAMESGEVEAMDAATLRYEAHTLLAVLDGIEIQWFLTPGIDLVDHITRYLESSIARWQATPPPGSSTHQST